MAAAVMSGHATSSIGTTEHHKICQGDTIELTTRKVAIFSDTILYDTLIMAGDPEPDTIINVYDVNIYPPFIKTEYKELEVGKTIEWCDTVIDRAGTYERRYHSIHGCDSIYRLHVTEYVFTTVVKQVTDTLCGGSSLSFGGQTLTKTGVYYDTIHFSRYDSVTILTLNVVKPDTVTQEVRIPQGQSWEWNGQSYDTDGVYDSISKNRFGCDSLSRLVLTVYTVDTIDTVVSICPSTTFTWHGMTKGQTGVYEYPGVRTNGDRVMYRLDLTVKPLVYVDTLFTLCDEESVLFHGKTYVNAGEYYDAYTCDTTYRITVVKHPSQLFLQTGVLDRTNPYYWQYVLDGEAKTDTILQPGVYEHTSHNATTGCNDTYRLILTKDETKYHFIENVTICESEPYNWHNLNDLNKQGIGQTTHYFDRYRTAADQDSIYELILTVKPVQRTIRTIPFCGSIEWNGKTYTESTTIIDTVTSVLYNCDSISTTILSKATPVFHKDTLTIVGGETLSWHGQTITTAGDYTDIHHSLSACDTTYMLHVELTEPAHTINTHSEWYSICQGDGQDWRNHTYYNSGTYYDTIKTAGGEIDSLYILYLTVNKTYTSTERVTFLSFPQTYRELTIPAPGAYTFTYQSTFGCDSIITAYIDLEVYEQEEFVTICPGQSYIWAYDGETYTVSGKYTKTEKTVDGATDSVRHILNLTVRYIPETLVEETICKGQPYVFGDQTLTQSGVYHHTFHKTGGCDSVVTLSLNVLSPDTTYLAIQRPQGSNYQWGTETITEPGMYFRYGTNRFGCDSVSILNFTYNQVDTIADTITVCQNELPYTWNGIVANQTNHYSRIEQQPGGNYIFYSLDLTVRNVVQADTTLSICEGGSITYNGVTYDVAGHYRTYISCDTLMNVTVIVNQPVIYETHGYITDDHGYTWSYIDHGTAKTESFTTAGTYEFENPNAATGCNDIYRLILTQDESEYHFDEVLTICEGDDFTWHGLSNLSSATGTNTYRVEYETHAGKDSIYTLMLTVIPTERTVRTIVFCDEITWNGKTYTEDAVVYDTTSLSNGCYRIERINLDRETPFYSSESKQLPQGSVLHWHGQNITTDGTYYDAHTTVSGCDSIYEITITIIPASPESNQYAEELSTCEGDTIVWRGKNIWRSGTYVDTVYTSGTNVIDSIFTLKFTVWPAPKDTIYQHMYTCADGASIRYNGKDYYQNDTVVTNFHTIHGCDSIVKVYMHFNTATYLSRTDTIIDKQLPFTWTYQLSDTKTDTVITTAGTYHHITASEGNCTNREELILVVLPTYLYEKDTTICERDLPFKWLDGPADHVNDELTESKQWEYRYESIYGTDSIYRLNLTIEEAPKRIEQISICENKDTLINGKSYFDKNLYPVGQVFRDTAYKPNPGSICDSIIYYEITKVPQRHIIETRILHQGESFEWHDEIISAPVTKTYTKEDEIDPLTGCEIIYQIRVVAENRLTDTICVLDTPYVWTHQHGTGIMVNDSLFASGMFTDTVFDNEGRITDFLSLDLTVTPIRTNVVQLYLCDGDKETLPNGKVYHNLTPDSIYRDTIVIPSPLAGCDSTVYYEILQHPLRTTIKNEVLREGDTIFWMGDTITKAITKTYTKDSIDEVTGCKVINQLRVVAEHRDIATICALDTPYVWVFNGENYYTTGLFTDTVRDAENFITEYHTLDLTVKIPVDTLKILRGCQPEGVTWNGITYLSDTIFRDTLQTCDTLYTVKIKVDTTYTINIIDTICQNDLPYILGRQNPDTIWEEVVRRPHTDTTACGCDSTVYLTLRIIPELTKNDSTFVCEDFFNNGGFVYLGDTIDPWFEHRENGKYSGQWIGKWHGVRYAADTIVYNCDSSYFHHIIVRPHQAHIPDYTYSICKGDSVQLFWPHDTTWISKPGIYMDTVPTISSWYDMTHSTTIHNDRAYECDSVTRWLVVYADTLHEHLYAHIREGETYRFNDSILSTTGVYDSIADYNNIQGQTEMDSAHNYCKAVYSLHLYVEPVTQYNDTIEICHIANREYTYTFSDDHEIKFQTPDVDTVKIDLADSTKHLSYEFYDHYYNLTVYYKQQYFTQYDDTICEGQKYRFDIHRDNATIERWLNIEGTYRDTLEAWNGCDSIIELRLRVRYRNLAHYDTVMITDREIPYLWHHSWTEDGLPKDSTDTLRASGDYTFMMPSIHGCDSVASLHFTVHQTHVFRDTIDICNQINKTLQHEWSTGYIQKFTTPLVDDSVEYADTLQTRIRYDSIYVLLVNFHRTYETHIYDTICNNGYRYWYEHHKDGTRTTRSLHYTGTYYDTIPGTNLCDSVLILHLFTRDPVQTKHFTQTVTDRELPYLWSHDWKKADGSDTTYVDTLWTTGNYSYVMPNQYGCDSTVAMNFTVHQTSVFRDTIDICQPVNKTLQHTWSTGYVQQYTTPLADDSVEYADTLVTRIPLDSIYVLLVNFHRTYETHIYDTICAGDSVQIDTYQQASLPKRFYKETGIYHDTIPTFYGCDSIITLHLQVWPGFPLQISRADIADVDTPYIWTHTWWENGQLQTENDSLYAAGGYSRTLKNIHGCDSIDSLTLYIHNTYKFVEEFHICERQTPYTWQNRNDITESGTYIYNPRTHDGYDSIYIATITVVPTMRETIHREVCENDLPFEFHNKALTTGGIYIDTITSDNGCDSIVELHLTVNYPYRHFERRDIYEGQTYDFFGQACTTSGTYTHSATTPAGCDSITELMLVVHPLIDTTAIICSSELPFAWVNHWNGSTTLLHSAGLYHNDTTFVNGERTFWSINLIVNEPVFDTIRHAMCEGASFDFKGNTYHEAGIYRDTLRAANGCDSIVTLILTVNQPYYNVIRETILEGHSYEFYGQTYTATGTYTHFERTPEGCDSTTVLQLSVHPLVDTIITVCNNDLPVLWNNRWNGNQETYYTAGLYRNDTTINGEKRFYGIQINVNNQVFDTIRHAMCEGASFDFKGNTYHEAGIYRDTLRAANGCDSIVTLILTVNQPYYNVIRETILEGHSYEFYGQTCTATGTYTHFERTPEGCDSTTVLQLSVHPLVDTIITVCNNDLPVIWTNRWNGNQETYYTAGLYRNDTTINGEKRFYGIQINVNNQVFDTIRHSMCEGDGFYFKNKVYRESGIIRDTLMGKNGCDSIVTLILTVNKPVTVYTTVDIFEGETYAWMCEQYSTSGTYRAYGATKDGCDSIFELTLRVHPVIDTIVTICKSELPYAWVNKWSGETTLLYQAGLYRNDTTYVNGERTFYSIQLNVNEAVYDTVRAAICEGNSYLFNGMSLTNAGIYRDTTRATNGCDSITTLILTVNKPYFSTRTEHIFEGQQVPFFDTICNTTGTYYHYGRTPEGCDSTTMLQLYVHKLVDTVVVVCSNDLPYTWINKWDGSQTLLYTAGTYRNDTTYVNGERMFYGLQLIVNESTTTTLYRSICEGSQYTFNGQALTTSGEYRDTLRNAAGCDSIVILHLNVEPTYYHADERTIFEGDSVLFQGQFYSAAGVYPVRYTTATGCDSIIELRLTVNRLYDDSVTVCANELPLTWRGHTIYESGVYRDTVVNTMGKQTIIGHKVNVLPIARATEPINKTICEGDFFKFGKNILTEQGTYYDTLTAANGCDSIVMLALTVIPIEYTSEVRRIFEGDTVVWHGDSLYTSGVYEYRSANAFGCINTDQLILTVLKSFNIDTAAVICDSDLPFIWRGIEYNESGDYTLPISWTDSSRVVKTLHLTVNKSFYGERNISLCAGDTFLFKGRQYYANGEFNDTIPSNAGCDSIIKYIISIHPTYDKIFEKHISDKQPYVFHDRVLTLSGTYEWTGKTIHGCDSMEHLLLTVHPSYFRSDTFDLCQSDTVNFPFKWRDENGQLILEIAQSGVYTDSILTEYGFDSVRQAVVHVHPSYLINEQYEIGEGEHLKIHGRDISSPAIYYDTLRTVFGCDSIYHIVVNQKRTREFTWNKTICQGEYFDFFGRKLTQTGQYKYTSQYKDSLVTLTLTVNPVTYSEKRVVVTDKITSYTGTDGKTYYSHINEGMLYDSLVLGNNLFTEQYVNQYGCDSIARLIIVVSTHYSEWTPIPLCAGSELKIDNQVITEAGLYTFLRRSRITGEMDSIWRVEVYDAPAYEFDVKTTMCDGDTLFFGNKAVTRGGKQDVVLKTVDGCDSIFHVDITLFPSYKFDTTVTIFDYQTYTWEQNHQTYNIEGRYVKTYPTIHDCDSTYVLNLKVIQTIRQNTEYTICEGQEYTWRGKQYSTEGFYTDTVDNAATYQSAIYTLHLIVVHPTYISNATGGAICADDREFNIEFTYTGAKPTFYSIYYDQAAKDQGFIDVIDQPFLGEDRYATGTVPTKPEVLYLNHTNYVKPGTYTMSLVLDNGVCGVSRADNIELVVKYPSWIIEQNWNDIVVPLKKELNGGYEFDQVEWFVNGVRQHNNGKGYLEHNFRDGDEVIMEAHRKGDKLAYETCPLIITLNPNLSYDEPILVYPTQAPRHAPRVFVEVPKQGSFEVIATTGLIVARGDLSEGQTQITLPAISGIYFIRVHQGDEVTSHKVMIY